MSRSNFKNLIFQHHPNGPLKQGWETFLTAKIRAALIERAKKKWSPRKGVARGGFGGSNPPPLVWQRLCFIAGIR